MVELGLLFFSLVKVGTVVFFSFLFGRSNWVKWNFVSVKKYSFNKGLNLVGGKTIKNCLAFCGCLIRCGAGAIKDKTKKFEFVIL